MGSYDTVHTGFRCGQTKALGKGYRDLVPGAEVRSYPCARNAADYQRELAYQIPPGPDSFQVAMYQGGYLTVRKNVLLTWNEMRDLPLPLLDNGGHPSDEVEPVPLTAWEKLLLELGDQPVVETADERFLNASWGRPNLADLIPGSGEHRARSEELRQSRRAEFDSHHGLPNHCTVCTELCRTR